MYQIIDNIPVWGEPLQNAVAQAVTCAKRAVSVALMADHHLGYSMPIGGVAAYDGYISPSGVGYDISCLVAGTLLTTADGRRVPIEKIIGEGDLLGNDQSKLTNVGPAVRLNPKMTHQTLQLTLQSGDTLKLTADHLLLTPDGWKAAEKLKHGDVVAVSSYIGLEAERDSNPLDYRLVRLLGHAMGDGHASKTNHRISFYTSQDEDAALILTDLRDLGFGNATNHRRVRPNGSIENQVYCNSQPLHTMFANRGLSPGRSNWQYSQLAWLLDLPKHLKAAWLGGMFSAEMASPLVRKSKLLGGAVMKQGGLNPLPLLQIVKELLNSLGFESTIYPSGQVSQGKQTYQILIHGGHQQTIRLWRMIGFPYAKYKQRRAAEAMSIIWQRQAVVQARGNAVAICREFRQAGMGVYDLAKAVVEKTSLPFTHSIVLKAIYEKRGVPRVPIAMPFKCATDGEFIWSPIVNVERIEESVVVYDIPLTHHAHNFLANGVVAHNCGNKAVLLDADASEVRANIKTIMDNIWHQISFGIGRKNQEAVDHELFYDDPAWAIEIVKRQKQMAREQLGTVGSGNHYVDLFIDEQNRVWCGVHFGSRGLGHHIATHYIKAGGGKDGIDVEPVLLAEDSPLGQEYLAAMHLAGRYAYAGRDWVCQKVAKILGATIVDSVHNHHNYCIAGDQKIPTPSGYKRMRDIVAGDTVYAFDETDGIVETSVLEHWKSGEKLTYTIRTRSRELRVSGTHPVLTIQLQLKPHPKLPWLNKNEGVLSWVQASDIKSGDIIVCVSGYYDDESHSIGEGLARFVGAYLGDGWLRQSQPEISGYGVGLAVGGTEDNHTEKYLGLCTNLFPSATWSNNAPGAFGLTCSSKKVHDRLNTLGLAFKSREKKIPNFAFHMPLNEKLALLAGYFDADGSVSSDGTSNHGRGQICSVSQELVEGIRELAIACNMQVTPMNRNEINTNYGPCIVFRCTIAADSVKLLALWHAGKSNNQRFTTYQKGQALQALKIGYKKLPECAFAQRVIAVTISEGIEPVYDMSIEHKSHAFICEGVVVHNCWPEQHMGKNCWVVRKGATPAFPGQRSFVGGTMGEPSVILEGIASAESQLTLNSTVHGAGRIMSRTQASGKKRWKKGKPIQESEGLVSRKMMMNWVREANVELRGAGTDESPHCYKRLDQVLGYHKETVRILHTLTPIGVAMAGENEFDPFKD